MAIPTIKSYLSTCDFKFNLFVFEKVYMHIVIMIILLSDIKFLSKDFNPCLFNTIDI